MQASKKTFNINKNEKTIYFTLYIIYVRSLR